MPRERDVVDNLLSSAQEDREIARDFLILGYLHMRKWDRAFEREEKNAENGNTAETTSHMLQNLADGFSEADVSEFHQRAALTIRTIEDDAVDRALSALERAKPRRFLGGVIQSVIAAFVYSILILIAWVIYEHGSKIPWP